MLLYLPSVEGTAADVIDCITDQRRELPPTRILLWASYQPHCRFSGDQVDPTVLLAHQRKPGLEKLRSDCGLNPECVASSAMAAIAMNVYDAASLKLFPISIPEIRLAK